MKEMNLGRILIENRHKRGITQDELAAHIGVSKGAVSKWETGGAKPRKYYQRTKYGTEIYEKLKAYWQNLSAGMERLLREEES